MDNKATYKDPILQQPLILHIGAVLLLLWIASFLRFTSPFLFIAAFLFLYEADRRYIQRTQTKMRHEERRSAFQRRPLSDAETVHWLNQAIEKVWPIFLERFVTEQILSCLIPWFLDKYKPWTARKAILRHLHLGRSPPFFTAIRTIEQIADDDHLVMDLGLDYLAAQDMNAVLVVQMRRRLGLGFWTTIHISNLQLEGKVRVGIKFSNEWPFLSRVRLCFENAPYVKLTARPLFNHGVDVTELPGIAGWVDRMLADILEQSLVEPNMLVINMERLVSNLMGSSFSHTESSNDGDLLQVHKKDPIAILRLEILEAADLKPSDLNGLADPFVRGALASYQFKTKIQWKTLRPRWQEEFQIPIGSWDLPNLLVLEVRDKDKFRDDELGCCKISISEFRGGQRHDIWLPLEDVKMGRLHMAVTILESTVEIRKSATADPVLQSSKVASDDSESLLDGNSNLTPRDLAKVDEYEAVDFPNGENGIIAIMKPGQPVAKKWHHRRRKPRGFETKTEDKLLEDLSTDCALVNLQLEITDEDSSSGEEGEIALLKKESKKGRFWEWKSFHGTSVKGGVGKEIDNSVQKVADPDELVTVENKGTTASMTIEESYKDMIPSASENLHTPMFSDLDTIKMPGTPTTKVNMKTMAKDFIKHAAHGLGHASSRKTSSRERCHETGTDESQRLKDNDVDLGGYAYEESKCGEGK